MRANKIFSTQPFMDSSTLCKLFAFFDSLQEDFGLLIWTQSRSTVLDSRRFMIVFN